MRPSSLILSLAAALAMPCLAQPVRAQRHTGGSSPPTAPPLRPAATQQPIVLVSSGLGSLQFNAVNYGVPAPQSLTRQLEADDDRTRGGALAAIGAPAQYLNRGHIPFPHSMQLDFVPLGNTDDLDALLTVELDQHLVTAVLKPEEGSWKRIGTVVLPTPFYDPTTTPATFLRTARAFDQPNRYRAIFRSYTPAANGDYFENEAELRVLNGRAVITISFVASARNCEPQPGKPASRQGCEITQRWLQADSTDPTRRFTLVSGSGRLTEREALDPLNKARQFLLSHLRNFTCQPLVFSESEMKYEPIAPAGTCTASPKPVGPEARE